MAAPSSTPRSQSDSGRLLRRIWKGMSPEERGAAVRAAAKGGSGGTVQALRMALVTSLRMRPNTVQSWSAQQLADNSARINLADDLIAELLVALHLNERVELLSAFLDAAGVAHTDGVTDDAAASETLAPEKVLAAADEVLARFPQEQCRTYFATLLALESSGWAPLRERVDPDLFE